MQHSLHAYGAWILQVYKFPAYQPTKGSIESSLRSTVVLLFCDAQASLYLVCSGPNRRYPWKQKLAIVRLFCLKLHVGVATELLQSFFICLLPVIHLIHLGHQWTKILPGVPLNLSLLCPPLFSTLTKTHFPAFMTMKHFEPQQPHLENETIFQSFNPSFAWLKVVLYH